MSSKDVGRQGEFKERSANFAGCHVQLDTTHCTVLCTDLSDPDNHTDRCHPVCEWPYTRPKRNKTKRHSRLFITGIAKMEIEKLRSTK